MAFDRFNVDKQPYFMVDGLREVSDIKGIYVDKDDSDYTTVPKGFLSPEERVERARQIVARHPFVWDQFDGDMPFKFTEGNSALRHPHHAEAIARLKRNCDGIKPALNMLQWFSDPGVYLAGGSIVASVLGEEIKDFDFFFKDKKTRLKFQEFVMAEGYEPVAVTNNAITLTKDGCTPIQLIFNHYYDHPEFCIMTFDWSLPQVAIFSLANTRPGWGVTSIHEPDPFKGLAYTCQQDWGDSIIGKYMQFNIDSLGSRHMSFFRALKYKQRYNLRVMAWGFDHHSITPSSLLTMEGDVYGIPKPWENIWTCPSLSLEQDLIGSIEDLEGSAYDNTLFLHKFASSLVDSHRGSWSVASARRVCSEMMKIIESSHNTKLLPIDNSIVEESVDERNRWYFSSRNIPVPNAYRQILSFCYTATPDKSFNLLFRFAMSLEVACNKEFEDITAEVECQDSTLNQL